MILKSTFCLLLILNITSASSQSYERYYKLCNMADSLEYAGFPERSLDTFKAAFSTVNYVHSEKYVDAYHLAIKLNAFRDAHYFGKMAVLHSGKSSVLATKSKSFRKSDAYQSLKDSLPDFLAVFEKRIHPDYVHLIDSLVYIDQYIIRGNRGYKGKFSMDETKLPQNRFDLDRSNWELLLRWIDSVGFPSEQLVGAKAYDDAWAILHHNLRLPENQKHHAQLLAFVISGNYMPDDMFFWYEQFQLNVNGTTYFTTWDGDSSAENLKRIDANRRAFYLKGIDSFILKKDGRSMTAKW